MTFRKATRTQLWLRMALMGSTKGGKSYTGLNILTYLVGDKRIAAIDTENGRLRLYAPAPGNNADPDNGTFDFDSIELDTYHPQKYIDAINAAVAEGYGGLFIDSLTHAWAGEGGLLEQKAKLDERGGNSYTNWGKITPIQNKLIETILEAPIHIIATMRAKMDYVIEANERGKNEVKKLGLAPVQRNDTEYEFDVIGMMESGTMRIVGSRCAELPEGKLIEKPGRNIAEVLNQWLGLGAELPMTKTEFTAKMQALGYKDLNAIGLFVQAHSECYGITKWSDLYAKALAEKA